ncbi:MAG: polyprenyl diphosphate synthase [Candidatus Marsarchaeota archaeon]|jgi:undecaprenyl diphosphate synthase|nr:polyprenyl diphosphate synthase [Candidatus Marsarchaeota archaeon]
MAITEIPRSIALIPDGNRRWARAHALSIFNGYSLGVKKFIDFTGWCKSYGITNIAVWAFSTENFSRDAREVRTLFRIYKRMATDRSILRKLHANRLRLRIAGNKSLLPKDLLEALHNVEEQTKHYKDRAVHMLLGYGGKDDILHAARSAALAADRGSAVSEGLFRKYLFTSAVPEIDFIIRTSGEQRLSGLLPWQTCYSELYFSKKLWPDFTERDLHAALSEYGRRQRRFGK